MYTHTRAHTHTSESFCYTADIKDNIVNHLYFNKIKQTNKKKLERRLSPMNSWCGFADFLNPKERKSFYGS